MATVGKDAPAPSQLPSSSSLPEDDSWKRSTDCIYFLASPLTCKKGKECEFRHSEAARNNPVDCWYWLNGKCSLNVSCAFRHPPLEGSQAGSFAGPSPPITRSVPPFISTPQNAAKQAPPCIFFQNGCCTKGGMCNFSHGPIHPPNTMIRPAAPTATTTEPPGFKKTFGGPEKVPHQKMGFQPNPTKVIETPRQPQANVAPSAVEARPVERRPTMQRYQAPGVAAQPANNGSLRSRSTRPYDAGLVDDRIHHNGREVDDSLRESSPGFDVLVDDKLEEDEYYEEEGQYVRVSGQEGRRSSNELDTRRHDDYNSLAHVDHDDYRRKRGYDVYNDSRDKYAREKRGRSSEIMSTHDKRGPYKPENPNFIQNSSDLRHRLSKPRRDDGLRSVISPDYKPNYHQEDRGYRGSRRDVRSPPHESSISSRLQGRIKLPRKSPPVSHGSNMYSERDTESRMYGGGRSSPTRPNHSSIQGRLRGRLGVRVEEENNDSRNYRGPLRRDSIIQTNDGDAFPAPKRLSEIRVPIHTDNKNQQSISGGKLRDSVLGSSIGTEGDILFDGPKPLSEILKRKRNAGNSVEKQTENDVDLNTDTGKPAETQSVALVHENNNETLTYEGDEAEEEAKTSNKKVKLIEVEKGEETAVDEEFTHRDEEESAVDPEVDEEYDQVEGEEEYEYENDEDVEGYNLNEGDVVDNEGFMDEDDVDDDFAKKLGVSF